MMHSIVKCWSIALITLLALTACGAIDSGESPTAAPTAQPTTPGDPAAPEPTGEPTSTPADQADTPTNELTGTTWKLVEYTSEAGDRVTALPEAEATLSFENGQIGGNASCNSYGGTYTLDGDRLTIEEIVVTEMACLEPEGAMEQEQAYLAALQRVARYQIEGDTLTLLDDTGAVLLSFMRQQPEEPAALVGTSWALTGFSDANTASSVLAATEVTALFGEGGEVSGSAGCNTYTASYTVEQGNRLTISPAASTRKACPQPEGVMQQEAQYLETLQEVAVYTIDGNTLALQNADGVTVLTFVAASGETS